uniref:C-type lectin domain-containing protein n=1 Tax=Arion vulgaris TaxID=1028688 RepID=A0A0B7ALG2_9EUPU
MMDELMSKQTVVRGIILVAIVASVRCQDNFDPDRPCEASNAITLPADRQCLVPFKEANTWDFAASVCERARGSLFQMPDSRLDSRPKLMRCLASAPNSIYNDMWINALGVWSPHFKWENNTPVNQVDYCTPKKPIREDTHNITSDSLSVDYCVSTCHDRGATYTIYYNNSKTLECFCNHTLSDDYTGSKCNVKSVNTSLLGTHFILQSREDSLIKITSSSVESRTEILCSTVDASTLKDREITSDKCLNRHYFICDLGDESKCVNTQCQGVECRVIMKRQCMMIVSLDYTWYAAKAYCLKGGGDLWNMNKINDLSQVTMLDARIAQYWIGATNYDWKFNADSADLGRVPVREYNRVRCGHMIRETSAGSALLWKWSDTLCDQQKAYLCQFSLNTFSPDEVQNEVTCPWPDTVPVVPDIPTSAPFTRTSGGEGYPAGGIIAAILALLFLLTCIGLAFAFFSRRKWLVGRFRKAREHLTFIPYFADTSGADYESHGAMSSVSDHGSQVGLVKGGYQHGTSGYGMSTSYGEQSGAFSSKSLDRKHKDAMERKLAENHNYLTSGNTSMDERGFSATYNTLPNRPRDFMTLQARMDIKDEAELAALRASFRNKPEVALVTDNVNMNFTVNHAVSRSHSQIDHELSKSSLERTMEEINLPTSEGGLGLNLPERVSEEARLYSTMTNSYRD